MLRVSRMAIACGIAAAALLGLAAQPARAEPEALASTSRAALREKVSFRGVVRDERERPIPRARVVWLPNRPTLEALGIPVPRRGGSTRLGYAWNGMEWKFAAPASAFPSATTDARGEFALNARWAGRARSFPDDEHTWHFSGFAVSAPGFETIYQVSHSDDPNERVEAWLKRELRVVGVAVDAAGAPISDATVSLDGGSTWNPRGGQPDYYWDRVAFAGDEIRADAAGHFAVAGLPAGLIELRVGAPGRNEHRVEVQGASGETIHLGRVPLARAGVIAGAVTDETGAAIAGADVWLADARADQRGALYAGGRALAYSSAADWIADHIASLRVRGVPHARTDARGRFRVLGRGSPTHDVYASAAGREPTHARAVALGASDVRLTLPPEKSFEVRVADANGRAIPEAALAAHRIVGQLTVIAAYSNAKPELEEGFLTPARVEVLGGGAFRVSGVGKGTLLYATAPGFFPIVSNVLGVPADAQRIALEPAPTIRGVVRLEDGTPAAGATIHYRPGPGPWLSNSSTTRDGAFSFTPLAPGEAHFLAELSGVGESKLAVRNLGSEGTEQELPLTILRYAAVSGVLRRHDGTPARDLQLSLEPLGRDRGVSGMHVELTTDSNGRFGMKALRPDRYRFGVDPDAGEIDGLLEFAPGESKRVELSLTAGAWIEGSVTGDAGPVADAMLSVERNGGADPVILFTARDGSYRGALPSAGRYRVLLMQGPLGHEPVMERDVEVAAGASARVDFDVPGGTVRGVVTNDKGARFGGSFVLLSRLALREVVATALSDASGGFEFRRVPPGLYLASVRRVRKFRDGKLIDYSGSFWPVAVLGNGRESDVSLTQRAWLLTPVEGIAREPNGALARDGTAVIVEEFSGGARDEIAWFMTDVTSGGRFRIPLPPGRYRLWATDGYPLFGEGPKAALADAKAHVVVINVGAFPVRGVPLEIVRHMPE